MSGNAEPLFVLRGRNKISSSPLLVDANDDGWPEIFVGGPKLRGLAWDGTRLPGWPRRGGRPFASSPAFGDITGDGRGSVVLGCDDGRIYAFHVDGERCPGWPIATGNDVFSTPALADVDGDGRAEVVAGSDDGRLYTVRGDGSVAAEAEVPQRPFISASPTILEGGPGGRPSVAVGAWDGNLYVWNGGDPTGLAPVASADHVIWSSAEAFEVRGTGACLAFAADRVYLASAAGAGLPGWPRRTGSWSVSSPIVVELEPGAGPRVIVGSDGLYAWDLRGRAVPGWPRACGDFVWASPLALDIDGDGNREVLAASWDGRLHAFRPDGRTVEGFPLWAGGAVFATPAAAPLPDGGGVLVTAAWDGSVRGWRLPNAHFGPGDRLQFRGNAARTGAPGGSFVPPTGDPAPPELAPAAATVTGAMVRSWPVGHGLKRVELEGVNTASARRCVVEYTVSKGRRTHIAPVVHTGSRSVAIIQALRRPHRIRYHVTYLDEAGRPRRWPDRKEASFLSVPIWARARPKESLLRPGAPSPSGSRTPAEAPTE